MVRSNQFIESAITGDLEYAYYAPHGVGREAATGYSKFGIKSPLGRLGESSNAT